MSDSHVFSNGTYTARVSALGAELCSLCDRTGREIMWTGGAWPRHSPVLFPIVGRLRDNHALIDGLDYTLTQHGFARDRLFRWVERSETGCTLMLEDDPTSRTLFPSAFRLILRYTLDEQGLHVHYTLANPDSRSLLHASLGAHPAFIWPLTPDTAKDSYVLDFDAPEPGSLALLQEGLIAEGERPNPMDGSRLALNDDLFEQDALIFMHPVSRQVKFHAPEGEALLFSWHGFEQLGIWMKPGSDFLCLEPWMGYASPVDFDGPFEQKPGLLHLPPGGSWEAGWSIRVEE
ncbi:aldose 1-epimerase family protein [Asaia lannensis]|uniref:Aldose 1-epimerase family protein n=1 Tax=Asaia lannensis NBRC 102526 TaxID=1307926 RepID=A0ABT1CJW3_9PROT|nr:aldose 1-epimerase family protein [Asaia lannensis]MCO6160289.1 aldose 1-epimerase family protein [Asaia lannensis NBRC 102526]GBQ94864.1 galactose mutarotase [Asaia lannensis NBRC 102526]